MNKLFTTILATACILVFTVTGCRAAVSNAPVVSFKPVTDSLTAMDIVVIDFVKNSSTSKFDGIQNSLSFTKTDYCPISSCRTIEYTVKFQSAHPGFGDRSGQVLAPVITDHTAKVYYDQDNNNVFSANCDNTWDMLQDRELPKYITGYVVSGGGTAQPGEPLDVPLTFLFKIKQKGMNK